MLVFGDFNARTKTIDDSLVRDKYDEILGIDTCQLKDPLKRNSSDKKDNSRGKELLDICKINDLLIANGRTIGDIFGSYTCYQWNGASVVDYLLSSYAFSDNIIKFKVGRYLPHISDHSPIVADVKLDTAHENILVQPELSLLDPRYFWSTDASTSFRNNVDCPSFSSKAESIKLLQDPIQMVSEIKKLLTDTAFKSHIKKVKRIQSSSEPWFDTECRLLKKSIVHNGKLLRRNPHDHSIRDSLYIEKKQLKNMVKRKKNEYKNDILKEMCTSMTDKDCKNYWKLLRKLSKRQSNDTFVSENEMIEHFKKTLCDGSVTYPITSNHPNGGLDFEITHEELKLASKSLKTGKSPGLDNVLNEMLKPILDYQPELLLILFNNCLKENVLNQEWLTSIICTIHKKGAKDNPDNYRGISLMSCIGKLFFTILNNRLVEYLSDRNILSEGQLGFQKGNRTSDPHIIIHNLILKYCHKSNKRIFSCFVDFKKAFDNVSRQTLLEKLQIIGVDGKFYSIIESIYINDKTCVKIGDMRSSFFSPDKGVRQGCVLSTTLFNIYLHDFQGNIENCGDNVKISCDKEICALLWADDILILSETSLGLQRKLDALGLYCKNNKLTANIDKTVCMIFNKTGRLILKERFYLNNSLPDNVRKYKYLGFIITPSGEIQSGLEDLRIRGLRAMNKLKSTLGPLFRKDVQTTFHLYNTMVKPIILYCSDFWGCLKLPKSNPIEKLHNMFCKQLLGVQKQTPNIGVLLELGVTPVSFGAIKASLRNWSRISKNLCNKLLRDSVFDSFLNNMAWGMRIKSTYEYNGMLEFILDTEKGIKLLMKRIEDQFYQSSFATINAGGSKLSLYSLIKSTSGYEKYLSDVKNIKHRISMTKLRLSNHSLNIEIGRHSRIPKDLRVCPVCPSEVECEKYFLFQCTLYKNTRDKFIPNGLIDKNNHDNSYFNLMKQKNVITTAKLIYECFSLRKIFTDVKEVVSDMVFKSSSNSISNKGFTSEFWYKTERQSSSVLILKRINKLTLKKFL